MQTLAIWAARQPVEPISKDVGQLHVLTQGIESMETPVNPNPGSENPAVSPDAQAQTVESPSATLEKRIAELEAQVKEKEAKYLYLYADFENAKKRAIKERSDLIKFGWENVARDLLQVVDNLDRAVEHIPTGTDANFAAGIKMISTQFKAAMQKQGVEEVSSIAKPFDPNLHEAVGQETSEHPEGSISKELSKGYTLHGRLLRPARVLVSSGQGANLSH
jgi:molecular chaperone GrpE